MGAAPAPAVAVRQAPKAKMPALLQLLVVTREAPVAKRALLQPLVAKRALLQPLVAKPALRPRLAASRQAPLAPRRVPPQLLAASREALLVPRRLRAPQVTKAAPEPRAAREEPRQAARRALLASPA
jgi:hypothetical protein